MVFYQNCYAHSEILKPVHRIEKTINPVSFAVSHEMMDVTLKIKVDDGWHLYSEKSVNSGYPFSVQVINIKNLKGYEVIFPESHEVKIYSDLDVISRVYDQESSLVIRLEPVDIEQPVSIQIALDYGVCKDICAVFSKSIDYSIEKEEEIIGRLYLINMQKFAFTLILALCGGFILNFMPCVLPVLSIKIISIAKNKGHNRRILQNELIFTVIGTITTFFVFSLITVLLKSIGVYVGWGMHFHEPAFLMFLAITLMLIAYNMWGFFEIKLKFSAKFFSKLTDISEQNWKYIGSFANGVLITLLATPCVAPMISTAFAFSLTQKAYVIILVHIFMGLGMSMPYIFMMCFPAVLKIFPKPGKWMIIFKKTVAISILITALWILYILFQQVTFESFSLFIGAIVASKMLLLKIKRKKYIISSMLITGVITISSTIGINELIMKRRAEIDMIWQPYTPQKLKNLIDDGKIVFLDITASWCINCQYNKIMVLNKKDIMDFMKNNKVVLIYADYTKKSSEIEDLIKKHGKIGVPTNIIYCSAYQNGIILPEILSELDVKMALNNCLSN